MPDLVVWIWLNARSAPQTSYSQHSTRISQMREPVKLLLLLVLVCFLPSISIAQKPRRTARRPSALQVVCKIASVPNGMVVIGYKHNSACSDGYELLVKRPEDGDIICAGSP